MVNDSHSPIKLVEENKKQYTARDIKRPDRVRLFQHINCQPVKWIIYAVDNNILQNFSILWEDVGIAEENYGPIVPHLQGKTVHQKFQHVEPVLVPRVPKGICDRYNNVTICCDLTHINVIAFLNTISWYILFSMVSMVKTRRMKNIEEVIKQVKKTVPTAWFKYHPHTLL